MDVAAQAHTGGEIHHADLTGREFISLLKELRLIFLQDAAILQPIYPDLPLWRLPVFRDPEWNAFAEAVRYCQEVEEEPADVRIRAVVPAIAEAVHGAIKAIMALQTGVVLQEKSLTGGCRRGSRKACNCHM